jgi:hypothetical protein
MSKVYYVEFTESIEMNVKSEKHFYFGSKTPIYDTFSAEQLRISTSIYSSFSHREKTVRKE